MTPTILEEIWQTLETVIDPELYIDVVKLGLIYKVEEQEGKVQVEMTLTTPMCPYGPELMNQVNHKLNAIERVKDCIITLVFDPPWGSDKISEEVRLELGFDV